MSSDARSSVPYSLRFHPASWDNIQETERSQIGCRQWPPVLLVAEVPIESARRVIPD